MSKPHERTKTPDESPMTVVYVLTTTGADRFADMATISAISVRLSNPHVRIAVASDPASARGIKHACHPLLDCIDELRVVESSYPSPVHRNRHIKTSLYDQFEGPTFNLDADTIVRGSLDPLLRGPVNLGAVANHNGTSAAEQLWSEDAEVLAAMGWQAQLNCYINTGVIFYRPAPAVKEFYALWNTLWAQECKATGRGRDQPSCYAALATSRVHLEELPAEFNMQFSMHDRWTGNALVWHFYQGNKSVAFPAISASVRVLPMAVLQRRVRHVMEMPFPWPNSDFSARLVCRRLSADRPPNPVETWWLNDRSLASLRQIGTNAIRRFCGARTLTRE